MEKCRRAYHLKLSMSLDIHVSEKVHKNAEKSVGVYLAFSAILWMTNLLMPVILELVTLRVSILLDISEEGSTYDFCKNCVTNCWITIFFRSFQRQNKKKEEEEQQMEVIAKLYRRELSLPLRGWFLSPQSFKLYHLRISHLRFPSFSSFAVL